MAWEHLSINKPHLVYIILGGFTTLFMLVSSIIKERLYIGEATVATICGVIFGPYAANLIDPGTWGNEDQITLEFSRIVLVVQCFAVGVELPKAYMERHWKSVTFLLIPVMTFGWLVTSLFIWAVFHQWANWLDCLCMAACVTATDPVLASSVVGKGKFAKRVPKHLRDLLSCESGCNDGMAFPFVYLAVYILRYKHEPNDVALHWFCFTILYECIFGATYGVLVGYAARRAIRFAHEKDWIDRESFLVFYFVLALFCAGSGSLLGMDDLLVGFACGVGFSNDGWFTEKTEEAHVSNVIDLLINLAFFVYFGTIIPWNLFNVGHTGLDVWRLVVIAILVLFFRRIPIMLALKPIIPDIKTWREALFAGHFGPIGVGAIFVAILARAELETEETTPLAHIPDPPFPHRNVIELIWPITTFLVITSILVHGSSVAVFTLGKHINTLTLTMSYTKAAEENNWMDRLPRIQSRSKSQMSRGSETDFDEKLPPGTLPTNIPGGFLRRQREEDNPSRAQSRSSSQNRTRKRRAWESGQGPGGPISQSAIGPQPRISEPYSRSDSDTLAQKESESPSSSSDEQRRSARAEEAGEIYEEGDETVYEDEEGNVLAVEPSHGQGERRHEEEIREGQRLMHQEGADRNHGVAPTKDDPNEAPGNELAEKLGVALSPERQGESQKPSERPGRAWREGLRKMSTAGLLRKGHGGDEQGEKEPSKSENKQARPARAYQFGNTIIVEDEDGEVIKKYDIPSNEGKGGTDKGANATMARLGAMGKKLGIGARESGVASAAEGASQQDQAGNSAAPQQSAAAAENDDDDIALRFTTGGRRMSKAEFINSIRDMDPKRRVQAVEQSNAPEPVKQEARKEARERAGIQRTGTASNIPIVAEQPEREKEQEDGMAALRQINSSDSHNDLHLVDSGGRQIPVHDVASDLKNYSMSSPTGETAAERRRREALESRSRAPEDDDSEDDGTERVPPAARRGASPKQKATSDAANNTDETAAERRRREGALGIKHGDEGSDSDEEEMPRQPPKVATSGSGNIRFADMPSPSQATTRQSTLRWGKDRRT